MRLAKRLIDLVLSSVGLVLVLPLLLLAGLAVWVTMGRPVVFRQERAGLHGRPFTLYKLRTMRDATGPDGQPLPDAVRLTRVGRALRKLSIDELPQLWNVLRGDMSLVGPRPLLERYMPYYTAQERRRFDALPGITGWAQVNGRNAASWTERLTADVWYVEHRTLLLDLQILVATVVQAGRGTGVSVAPGAEMDDLDVERSKSASSGGRPAV